MVYGWNFNNTPIPESVRAKFRREVRLSEPNTSQKYALLVGICETTSERDVMLIQGQNETRRFKIVSKPGYFGFYAYHINKNAD